MPPRILILALLLGVVACAPVNNQNRYSEFDVGKDVQVEFGTIISERQVDIQGQNTGAGGSVGVLGGLAAGSAVGRGNGTLGAMIVGAIVGGVVGSIAEQELKNHKGIEYIITLHNKVTVSIVQNIAKDDTPLKPGERVMVQTSGHYRRVLPANDLPTQIKQPKQIEVK